jgi:hypothetical protein
MILGGYWLRFHKGIKTKKSEMPIKLAIRQCQLDGLKIRNLDPLFKMVHSITA